MWRRMRTYVRRIRPTVWPSIDRIVSWRKMTNTLTGPCRAITHAVPSLLAHISTEDNLDGEGTVIGFDPDDPALDDIRQHSDYGVHGR